MTVVLPKCFKCVHYEKGSEPDYKCKAFPGGIPKDVLINGHDKVVKGQEGDYTYKPK